MAQFASATRSAAKPASAAPEHLARRTRGRDAVAATSDAKMAASPAGSLLQSDLSAIPAQHTPRQARAAGKTEAAFVPKNDNDGKRKIEGHPIAGAAIGGAVGAGAGAVLGGVLGGGAVAGAIGGLVIGGVLGGIIGSRIGRGISWKDADYASDNSNADSVTTEQPSNVAYKAEADRSRNVWRLGVDSIEGGVDIHVHTGGSRDPTSAPPVNQGEASAAVTDMKGYYMRGNRGAWHTEGASHAHENHHFREWKDTCDHYWPAAKASIETVTAPLAAHANENAAIAAMRAGPGGADAKIQAFHDIAHRYWFTLSDSAGGRPYAAGQRVLNKAVSFTQDLASSKGWVVPQGTDDPNTEPPCYQPWLPFP